MVSAAQQIALPAQRFTTYTVLRYFISFRRKDALAPNIAALYEALLVLRCKSSSISETAADPVISSIHDLLFALKRTGLMPARAAPDGLPPQRLKDEDFSDMEIEHYNQNLVSEQENRLLLAAFVRMRGGNGSMCAKT